MADERQSLWRRAGRLALVAFVILSAGMAGCGEMEDDDENGIGGYEEEED